MDWKLGVQEMNWLLVNQHAGVSVVLEEALRGSKMVVLGLGSRRVAFLQELQTLIQVILDGGQCSHNGGRAKAMCNE